MVGKTVYLSLLVKDYRRKAGEIKALRRELKDLAKAVLERERDLRALSEVITARLPGFDAAAERPVSTWPKVLGLKWNGLTIAVLDCLREANGRPVPTDVILETVISRSRHELESRSEIAEARQCLRGHLKKMLRRGSVVRHRGPSYNSVSSWSLPRRDEGVFE